MTDLSRLGRHDSGQIAGQAALLARTLCPVCVLVRPACKLSGGAVVVHRVPRADFYLREAPIQMFYEHGFDPTEDTQLGLHRQKGA